MGTNKLTLELLTTFTVSNSLMANNNDRYSELLNTQLKRIRTSQLTFLFWPSAVTCAVVPAKLRHTQERLYF